MKKHTEILEVVGLEAKRGTFEPYGFSCKRFAPMLMPCFDRHNEIEIVYALGGSITYSFQGRSVVVPSRCSAIFWGMYPHRITNVDGVSSFYLCSIPLSAFLGMGLPDSFTNRIFRGEMLMDEEFERYIDYDLLLLENWRIDLLSPVPDKRTMMLEMQGRLLRMAAHAADDRMVGSVIPIGELDLVGQMNLYIATNYFRPIRVADVGRAVGLHPDYANALFKRVFGHTLSYHLSLERITQAQSKLLTTADTVVQIAEDCGFNSLSSFNAAFLKFNGCTPRDYRKHFRSDE